MATTTAETGGKSQAQLIFELKHRQLNRFKMGVWGSWLVLLAVLLLAFSGINFEIGGFHFRTIQLDFAFIRQ